MVRLPSPSQSYPIDKIGYHIKLVRIDGAGSGKRVVFIKRLLNFILKLLSRSIWLNLKNFTLDSMLICYSESIFSSYYPTYHTGT